MSNLTNYHSHCLYCDGRANMEEFVRFAIGEGFTSYGFSSHAPLPFSTAWTMEWEDMTDYLREFARMKTKYKDQIELAVGLEIDYLNDEHHPGATCFQALPLDYRIGSVHLLPDVKGEIVDVDVSAEVFKTLMRDHFENDVKGVVQLYYQRLRRMMTLGGFDILGHADKIHYNAEAVRPGILDEPWYEALMADYFSDIASKGYIVEINTKAHRELHTFYPNERYFSMMRELGIRVQVNSDAHYPERINHQRRIALDHLKQVGYQTVVERHHEKWVDCPIVD
ncbi:MAG: histidinol-phosphatase [Bacteroides sp.]